MTTLDGCWFAPLRGLVLAAAENKLRSSRPPTPPARNETGPATPIAEKKQELGQQTWDPQWEKIVEQALSPEMLSEKAARAARTFCPRFASMSNADKRAFWAYTFQALAGAEAGLKPTTDVRHTEPEVAVKDERHQEENGAKRGATAVDVHGQERYGCDFDWDQDKTYPEKDPAKTILTPRNNLLCGVKILENQIITQRKPLLSPSSYWVTLRPAHPSYLVFAKQMKNVPQRAARPPRRSRTKHRDSRTATAAAVASAFE